MKQIVQIDGIDRKIIAALQEDATLSNAALAERVGASAASCWRRIKSLEESGVLSATVRLADATRLGLAINIICHVRMRSHQPDSIGAFQQFVAAQHEIMECYSMSGDWDYLLRVVVSDVADYEHFLMRTLLRHPSVATAASHFALSQVKYKTALPI
jgi:Lrp/AsnC family transcriptional regulator